MKRRAFNLTPSTAAVGLAGYLATIIIFVLNNYTNIALTDEVIAAGVALLALLVSYAVPDDDYKLDPNTITPIVAGNQVILPSTAQTVRVDESGGEPGEAQSFTLPDMRGRPATPPAPTHSGPAPHLTADRFNAVLDMDEEEQ